MHGAGLVPAIAPLLQAYASAVSELSREAQQHVHLTIVLETTDTNETHVVVAEGPDATLVATTDRPINVRVSGTHEIIKTFIQASGSQFIVGPIRRGKITALRALRGSLVLRFHEVSQPEAVIHLSQADALALFCGTLKPQVAVMLGRIRIESGLPFLLSLDRIL
jgi:hypothetical protein